MHITDLQWFMLKLWRHKRIFILISIPNHLSDGMIQSDFSNFTRLTNHQITLLLDIWAKYWFFLSQLLSVCAVSSPQCRPATWRLLCGLLLQFRTCHTLQPNPAGQLPSLQTQICATHASVHTKFPTPDHETITFKADFFLQKTSYGTFKYIPLTIKTSMNKHVSCAPSAHHIWAVNHYLIPTLSSPTPPPHPHPHPLPTRIPIPIPSPLSLQADITQPDRSINLLRNGAGNSIALIKGSTALITDSLTYGYSSYTPNQYTQGEASVIDSSSKLDYGISRCPGTYNDRHMHICLFRL